MTHLMIHDLEMNTDLDSEAMLSVRGGEADAGIISGNFAGVSQIANAADALLVVQTAVPVLTSLNTALAFDLDNNINIDVL